MIKNIIILMLIGMCKLTVVNAQSSIDSLLIKELEQLAKTDQLAARNAFPPEEFKELSLEQWNAKKDSIYHSNQKRVAEIFENRGFLGYDIVGTKGSADFWAIVQHSDFDPQFQKMVLDVMFIEVQKQNASNKLYALLTDRVNINTGKKQVYGTQLEYSILTGKAKPIATIDPENLNKRREEVGLQPIEQYLEDMTKDNMAMTPTVLGLTIPSFGLIIVALLIALMVFVKIKKRKKL